MLDRSESIGTSCFTTVALTALFLLLPLVCHAPPAAAQPSVAKGCCQVPGACISPSRQAFCLQQPGGRFFAGHECGGGTEPECVLVQPVAAVARFQLSLDCGGPSPLVGSVALGGEVRITRRDAAGGDLTIDTEIVSMSLSGVPASFGATKLDYLEASPAAGESNLASGAFDTVLQPMMLQLSHPSCPDDVETVGSLPLAGSDFFSFPPLGGHAEAPQGFTVPVVAGGETVGTLSDFSLDFGGTDAEPRCPLGAQPSATLLVPYFEVDLSDAAGAATLLDVTNAADTFVVARVVLWTDLGVPTLTLWLYLSPSDVQSLNLRDLFSGRLPNTSAVLADPDRPVLDFEPCTAGQLAPSLSPAELAFLRAAHTGQPLPAGVVTPAAGSAAAAIVSATACAGIDRGDDIARGYVTVDVVRRCAYSPTVDTYLHRDALLDPFELAGLNALWGNYFYVDGKENFAQSETMVHRPYRPLALAPGDPTFYGRYVGFDASDGRLPLPGRYQSRFLQGGPFDGGTRLIVWRDNLSAAVDPIPCGLPAPWQPLGEAGVIAWDEAENAVVIDDLASICPGASGVAFACELQALPFPFGFLDLDLAHADGEAAQAVVVPVLRARGRFSVGQKAVPVDDRCAEPKAVSLQPFDQALDACEYEVIGFTDQCPYGFGDRIFVGCIGGRCPLPGPQGQAAVALCPDRRCGLGLRRVSYCQVRTTGARYKRVEKCK